MQPPPARRRITPVAVTVDEAPGGSAAFDVEQPLRVPPPPHVAPGGAPAGRGRRIWVDIQGSFQVRFKEVRDSAKAAAVGGSCVAADAVRTSGVVMQPHQPPQVLRQQGLDYATWWREVEAQRAALAGTGQVRGRVRSSSWGGGHSTRGVPRRCCSRRARCCCRRRVASPDSVLASWAAWRSACRACMT